MKKRLLAIITLSCMVMAGCAEAVSNVPAESVASILPESVSEESEEAADVTEATEVERTWLDSSLSVETRVSLLLEAMTLEEKAYQMVQAEQAGIDTNEITSTGIGSVLSGGGSAPATGNTVEDWNEYVNGLKEAALNSRLGIPLIYGVDAVHGHNNVYGATVFPHNVGLGVADDEELMAEIGKVTAEEVRATGIQWDFSPCLGNPQDTRWGRYYECFSSDTDVISNLTDDYIKALQENGVVACAKHYIGEGYTTNGENKGNVDMTEEEFDELLADGVLDPFTNAVNAGVLTVMPSYNSINGVRCHENYHLLTEVLKEQLGFKGFVISDYNAIDQVSGGTLKNQLATAVNAGVDMIMEPYSWDECAKYLVELVNEGKITEERIDDAVSRILYVKFTAGLFEEEIGSDEEKALIEAFGSEEHREVARRAVKESLSYIKEDTAAIEKLKNASYITVEGEAAYNLGRQCGGWTISWQGQAGNITEGTTIIEGIYDYTKDSATLKHSVDGSYNEETDTIVAVFGEMPYAESDGDRSDTPTICAKDIEMLDALKANLESSDDDVTTIGIVIAGRPLDLTDYEDMFDCIIMAYLPGTEGEGVADFLFE